MTTTWLRDKNGKIIMSGNTVRIPNMGDMIVVWDDKMARFGLVHQFGQEPIALIDYPDQNLHYEVVR